MLGSETRALLRVGDTCADEFHVKAEVPVLTGLPAPWREPFEAFDDVGFGSQAQSAAATRDG
jgi:hypothetical protein